MAAILDFGIYFNFPKGGNVPPLWISLSTCQRLIINLEKNFIGRKGVRVKIGLSLPDYGDIKSDNIYYF